MQQDAEIQYQVNLIVNITTNHRSHRLRKYSIVNTENMHTSIKPHTTLTTIYQYYIHETTRNLTLMLKDF
jgi:glutaredoxin-related protein